MKQRKIRTEKCKLGLGATISRDFKKNKLIWFMAIPFALWYIIFCYIPMGGIMIAFQRYSIARGIFQSPWVGLENFRQFFDSYYAFRIIKNTIVLSFLKMLFVFPASILLALLLNEVTNSKFKRTIQTVTYLPHFISLTVVCGMITVFVSKNGMINQIMGFFGAGEQSSLLIYPQYYRAIYIISDIWQGVGWGAIIYISALAGINSEYYEAATIDGANRFQKAIYVTIPCLLPTIVTMFIMNIGSFMSVGADKTILLYTENTYEVSDIIASFVYRRGIVEADYSFSAAVGLFNGIINLILVLLTNAVSNKVTGEGLW